MKRFSTLAFVLLAFTSVSVAQQFNKSLNKDSLFQAIIKTIPLERREELIKMYTSGSDGEKEFFLVMFSMPVSSKKELIKNIDSNYGKVNYLKTEYLKLVPSGYTVSIEFNPEDKIATMKESISLKITSGDNIPLQEWNLEYNSAKLNKMLKVIKWTGETLKTIKKLLADV